MLLMCWFEKHIEVQLLLSLRRHCRRRHRWCSRQSNYIWAHEEDVHVSAGIYSQQLCQHPVKPKQRVGKSSSKITCAETCDRVTFCMRDATTQPWNRSVQFLADQDLGPKKSHRRRTGGVRPQCYRAHPSVLRALLQRSVSALQVR